MWERGYPRSSWPLWVRPPQPPAPGTVNHLITGRLRPDLKRTVAFGLLALDVAAAVRIYGDLSWSSLGEGALTASGCLLFVALAVLAVRSGASEVAAVSRTRFGDAHAAVVALLLTLAGYAATVMSLLVLLQVPVGRLLVSGAVTGVVLGVAAQQSLGNVVAGLVLLLNRPFQVGQHITVRSGALAGPYTGQVLSIGLTYVHSTPTKASFCCRTPACSPPRSAPGQTPPNSTDSRPTTSGGRTWLMPLAPRWHSGATRLPALADSSWDLLRACLCATVIWPGHQPVIGRCSGPGGLHEPFRCCRCRPAGVPPAHLPDRCCRP